MNTNMLSKKQKNVFDFITYYIFENGIPPSMEEIRINFKLRAVSTVHEHINNLREKGYLVQTKDSARSAYPRIKNPNVARIAVIGKIAAGMPIEAIEDFQDIVSIVDDRIKHSDALYALKVAGDSMIDEGIFDGDIVVIKKQSTAENGQTVVAIIDEDKATLKKIYQEKNQYRLEPRNQSMIPFYRKEVEIRGIVFQIIRNVGPAPAAEINKNNKKQFKTLDLFAGIGGVRMGFERAGFSTVFANDFEENCRVTYNLNFKTTKMVVEDIKNLEISHLPEFNFLAGGFPCQAFSIAGYRQGFDDEKGRGNLFFNIARILEQRKPLGFLLENVKNLKTHDGGKTYKIIETTLRGIGYFIKAKILNSMEYGNIPQNRERIYIAGFLKKSDYEKFSFPDKIPLTKTIHDCLENSIDSKYYYNGKALYSELKKRIKKRDTVYQWRRKYVRENKNNVCPTLTANMGMGGHNVPLILDDHGIRKLTPRECANFQGFPATFKFPDIADSHLYKQIGNSVSIPVIERIAENIFKAME